MNNKLNVRKLNIERCNVRYRSIFLITWLPAPLFRIEIPQFAVNIVAHGLMAMDFAQV